jgi:hypothetical protein
VVLKQVIPTSRVWDDMREGKGWSLGRVALHWDCIIFHGTQRQARGMASHGKGIGLEHSMESSWEIGTSLNSWPSLCNI